MPMWYDRSGNAIDSATANRLLGEEAYKRVALTRITSTDHPGDRWMISTVWLGLDHNWGAGDPLIFETMTFGPDQGPCDHDQVRYATESEARSGHAEACRMVCEALGSATMAELDTWPKEKNP